MVLRRWHCKLAYRRVNFLNPWLGSGRGLVPNRCGKVHLVIKWVWSMSDALHYAVAHTCMSHSIMDMALSGLVSRTNNS